jgi:hypothetical protein
MARVRSPNFPIISLPQAVERIETIYNEEQTVPADRETVANHLGYSGLNGASLKMVSALGKYGLLEEMPNKQFRVSKLAMAILHPASDQEKRDALREAASGPALFQKLNEQFDGQRPSETNLRSWLLRNGFARSAVDSVVKAYNETMDLVSDSGGVYKPSVAQVASTKEERPQMHYGGGAAMALPQAAGEPFSVELLKGRVRVVGELSNREDAQTLMDFLKSALMFLPTQKQVSSLSEEAEDEDDLP